MDKLTLRVSEIFYSIQGESSRTGLPTVFIRLTGCPLRCTYCDTVHAFRGGKKMTISEIIEEASAFGTRYVTITGGEPLAQENCLPLMEKFCDSGFLVSLETSGAFAIEQVDRRVMVVLDLKTPSSNEANKNLWENLAFLKPSDQIKFVAGSRDDFEWAAEIIRTHALNQRCELLFSPVWGVIAPAELAQWLLESEIPARLQVQLHKVIWGADTRR